MALHTQLMAILEVPSMLIKEENNFCIKVSPAEDIPPPLKPNLDYFLENPILLLLLPFIFVIKYSSG